MKKIGLFFCFFILCPTMVFAIEFQPIGFESLSMGGAGVASARGSFAVYYNPALLSEPVHGAEFALCVGVGAREVNLVDHIDKLADIDIENTFDLMEEEAPGGIASSDVKDKINTIKNELQSIAEKNGLQLMPTVSLGMQIKNFGFGIFGLSEATGYAVIDSKHLDFIVKIDDDYYKYNETTGQYESSDETEYQNSSLQYAIENNLTYLKLAGLAYLEIPIAYAHEFETPFGTLTIGGAVKVMPGWTFDAKIDIDTASEDIDDELSDADKRDTSWGIDLGLLYKPKIPGLKIGLVGKNLNTPKFDTAKGNTYKIKPMVRAGVAYDFWKITFAADIDLTANPTFIPNYKCRFIGGGFNFHPFSWFSLRGGIMGNVAEGDEGVIFTAGLGFGLKWFQLDIAGQVSSKKGHFQEHAIPRYTRIQISLVSKWF